MDRGARRVRDEAVVTNRHHGLVVVPFPFEPISAQGLFNVM
ncbi:hypothetical protein ACFYUY_29040 [Kitasatospora sp. NPDC004745]